MDIINKLYGEGYDLSEMLNLFNDAVQASTFPKIDESIISKCRLQIKKNISHPPDSINPSERYSLIHKDFVQYDEKLINDLDNIYLTGICEWGASNGFIAIGYSLQSNFTLTPISNNQWSFLEINKDKSIAYGENCEYRNVKFYPSIKIKHSLTNSEREDLQLSIQNTITLESNTRLLKEAEIRLDNVYENAANKSSANSARTRETNLRKAIKSAIEYMERKPSLKELVKYFEDDKDKTGFIIEVTDTQVVWKDTRGNEKGTAITTVGNMLSQEKYTEN